MNREQRNARIRQEQEAYEEDPNGDYRHRRTQHFGTVGGQLDEIGQWLHTDTDSFLRHRQQLKQSRPRQMRELRRHSHPTAFLVACSVVLALLLVLCNASALIVPEVIVFSILIARGERKRKNEDE